MSGRSTRRGLRRIATIVTSSAGSADALEPLHRAGHRIDDVLRRSAAHRFDRGIEPLLLEPLAGSVARIGDAVRVEQQQGRRARDRSRPRGSRGSRTLRSGVPRRARHSIGEPSARTISGGSCPAFATAGGRSGRSSDAHRAVMNNDDRRSSTRIGSSARALPPARSCCRWLRASAAARTPSAGRQRCPCRSRRRSRRSAGGRGDAAGRGRRSRRRPRAPPRSSSRARSPERPVRRGIRSCAGAAGPCASSSSIRRAPASARAAVTGSMAGVGRQQADERREECPGQPRIGAVSPAR